MSVELSGERGISPLLSALDPDGPEEPARPNVSGDLPTVLDAAPMFRRTVAGYDRYQVDTYVQWAEDELSTAARERLHLETRHLRTLAALEEAEGLLAHSPAGAGFLRVSDRIGALLAAAADEAEGMRAEAEADRSAAAADVAEAVATAARLHAESVTDAEELVAAAATEARGTLADADRLLELASGTRAAAEAEADARLAAVRLVERRAAEDAERTRRQAAEDASAARRNARAEVLAMLATAREDRRRTDAAATAARNRLEEVAMRRRAGVLAEIDVLERRRAALQAEVDLLARAATGPTRDRFDVRLRHALESLRWRSRSLRAP